MLALYGRRQIGKTRLLTQWASKIGSRACFRVAEPTSASEQIRVFSQTIFNIDNPQSPAPTAFTYADWRQAFQQVAQLAEIEPLALIIDEFTYLLETVDDIAGLRRMSGTIIYARRICCLSFPARIWE